jgi:sec-independent protein translocase protein TatB
MIDLGLTKMALIGVVALVVIGPEKLPRVARMAGSLFGRAQRYINQVKSEVSREIELDELRKMHKEVEEAATSAGQSMRDTVSTLDNEINSAWQGTSDYNGTFPDGLNADAAAASTALKSRNFRKKRLARTTALPSWYKNQNGHRSRVMSGAARVARFTPAGGKAGGTTRTSFFS